MSLWKAICNGFFVCVLGFPFIVLDISRFYQLTSKQWFILHNLSTNGSYVPHSLNPFYCFLFIVSAMAASKRERSDFPKKIPLVTDMYNVASSSCDSNVIRTHKQFIRVEYAFFAILQLQIQSLNMYTYMISQFISEFISFLLYFFILFHIFYLLKSQTVYKQKHQNECQSLLYSESVCVLCLLSSTRKLCPIRFIFKTNYLQEFQLIFYYIHLQSACGTCFK